MPALLVFCLALGLPLTLAYAGATTGPGTVDAWSFLWLTLFGYLAATLCLAWQMFR